MDTTTDDQTTTVEEREQPVLTSLGNPRRVRL
jgi:hypothetical protein